ncbi:hypothetical protein STTU_4732 [Streptomyces sp. Tu6071]|nr:hypothetical protein STTU_4732 [Streptomyces sp. Tu6071]
MLVFHPHARGEPVETSAGALSGALLLPPEARDGHGEGPGARRWRPANGAYGPYRRGTGPLRAAGCALTPPDVLVRGN